MKLLTLSVLFLCCLNPLFGQFNDSNYVPKPEPIDLSFLNLATSAVYTGPICSCSKAYNLDPRIDTSISYVTYKVIKEKGKFGLVSSEDQVIFLPEFDTLYSIDRGGCCAHLQDYFYATKKNKSGIVKSDGSIKIPLRFDKVFQNYDFYTCIDHDLLTLVENDSKLGFVDSSGQIVIPTEYEEFRSNRFAKTYNYYFRRINIPAKKEGKWGVMNDTGQTIIPCAYDDIYKLDIINHPNSYAVKSGNKWGLVYEGGIEIMPPLFDEIQNIYVGGEYWNLVAVKRNNKWGVSDTTGKLIIPCIYDELNGEGDGCVAYRKGSSWGFINPQGKVLTSARYDEIHETNGRFALIKKADKWGVCNMATGKEIASPIYDVPFNPDNGDYLLWGYDYSSLMCWRKNGKYGVIDSLGKIVIPFIYDEYIDTYFFEDEQYSNGLNSLVRNGKKYLMNSDFKIVLGPEYDDFYWTTHSQGMVIQVVKNGKHGLLSDQGKLLIPPIYSNLEFQGLNYTYNSNGGKSPTTYAFICKKDDTFGIIDSVGKTIIPCKYDFINYNTNDNFFEAYLDLKITRFDNSGALIKAAEFEQIDTLQGGCLAIRSNYLFGFIDPSETTIHSSKYKSYTQYSNGNILVQDDKYYGLLDSKLNWILDCEFEFISMPKENTGIVREANRIYFINKEGSRIDSNLYISISLRDYRFFDVRSSNGHGICDSLGRPIIPPIYSKIKYFNGISGAIKKDGFYALCGSDGQPTTDFIYEKVKSNRGDYYCVRKDRKFGIVDFNGNELTEINSLYIIDLNRFNYQSHLIIETPEGKGLIDSSMHVIIPPNFSSISVNFKKVGKDDFQIVRSKKLTSVYNSKGQEIIPLKDQIINAYYIERTGLFLVSRDNNYGLINIQGDEISSFIYDKLIIQINGYSEQFDLQNKQPYLFYKLGDKYGVMSLNGKELSPAKYDFYRFDQESKTLQVKKGPRWISVEKVLKLD